MILKSSSYVSEILKQLPLQTATEAVPRLFAEILCYGFHPAFLHDTQGTAAFAVTAVETGIRLNGEFGIVIGGNCIPRQCQIVILVHKSDVNARRTGLAVVDHATVNTDETVTFTFKSGIEITEQL